MFATPQRIEIGLHAGEHTPRAEAVRLLLGHHFEVLEAVSATGDRGCAELRDDALERVDHGADSRVADHMESCGDPRLGAGAQVRRNRVGIEIRIAATVRGVAVGPAQPRGAGAERAVDEQVTGQPTCAGASDQFSRLDGAAHRFTPVADDLHAVLDATHLVPIGQAADVRPCALVHRDDAEGGGGIECGQLGTPPLFGCQPVAGGRPDQVVRVAGQGLLSGEAVRIGQTRCEPAQRGRGGCRVDVDPGQVRGPASNGAVDVGGAGRRPFGPAGFVPAVPPHRAVGMGAGVVAEKLQAVR